MSAAPDAGGSDDVPDETLNSASSLAELGGLQSVRLHKLKGALRNSWSIDVNGRWRLLFRFKDDDAFDVHIFDPH
jgi:toxin HigB-1